MTGLANVTIPSLPVEYREGFDVYGLSTNDISLLMSTYREHIESLFDKFAPLDSPKSEGEASKAAKAALETVSGQDFLHGILGECPMLCAQIIACASGDPSQQELAAKLPAPVQLDALIKIVKLTVEEAGGLKKLLGDVITILGATRTSLDALKE